MNPYPQLKLQANISVQTVIKYINKQNLCHVKLIKRIQNIGTSTINITTNNINTTNNNNSHNTTNINNITNNTINVQLVAYNKSDISHITDEELIKCLNSKFPLTMIKNLIKRIHFNEEKPESHNIVITNLKDSHVQIYDGEQWVTKPRDDTIDKLIASKEGILEKKIDEWIESNEYPEIMDKYQAYLDEESI